MSDSPLLGHASSIRGWSWGDWGHDFVPLVGLVVAAVLFAWGTRGRSGPARRRGAALTGGLVVVALALVSPVHSASATLLSAHMVQHLLLILLAAPLLVLGRPGRAMLMSLPRPWRRSVVSPALARATQRIRGVLARPVPAWIVFTVALWGWHLPAAYSAAVRSEPIHGIEHLCFLGTAMVAWSVVLRERSGEGLGALGRVLFLLATAAQSGLLGALLLFAALPLYPVHGLGPASWGLTPLQDQQLAGAIMWIPPGAVYLLVAVVMLRRWFRSMDSMDARVRPRGVAAGWGRR